MLATSQEYKQQINKPANAFRGLLVIDFLENWELPFAQVTATSTAPGYYQEDLANGRYYLTDYTMSGEYIPEHLKRPEQGWRGEHPADDAGFLLQPEVIEITYIKRITTGTFWVCGLPGEFPVDFTIEILQANNTWEEVQKVNDNVKHMFHITKDRKYEFQKMRITITRISVPGGVSRILETGALTTLVLDSKTLVDMVLDEETMDDSGIPVGSVTSNTLSFSISNEHRWYTPTNTNSPLYGLLQQGLRVTSYIGTRLKRETPGQLEEYEFLPWGTFYITEWDPNSDRLDVMFNAFDRVQQMAETEIPIVRARPDVKIGEMYEVLFEAVGLSPDEYFIDPNLYNQSLVIGWTPPGTFRDACAEMTKASNCNLFVDRLNKINVLSNIRPNTPTIEWTDKDQLITTNNPLRLQDVYSRVVVNWYSVAVAKDVSEVHTYKVNIPPRTTITELVSVQGPIAVLDHIKLGNASCRVTNIKYGAFNAQFELSNPTSASVELDVTIYGYAIEANKHTTEVKNPDSRHVKTFELDSMLIQNIEDAKSYGAEILRLISNPLSRIFLDVVGDPSVELKDVILVNNEIDEVTNIKALPYRQSLTFDGGLECKIEAITQVIPVDTVMISPGLFVDVPREVFKG